MKYIVNYIIYSRYYHRTQAQLQNYYSKRDNQSVNWLHYTFFAVLIVGAISIVVPLTNYLALVTYWVFIPFIWY